MLRRFIRHGSLTVHLPDGSERVFGDGGSPSAEIEIRSPGAVRSLVLHPELAFGETYMNGDLVIKGGDLRNLLALILSNMQSAERLWWQRWHFALRTWVRRFMQMNAPQLARRNVAHHYDLSNDFYELFLDEDWQYSCAYFRSPADTLEAAQYNKKHHIAGKLRIEPGMRVLDIGCGWGGLAITLAQDYGAKVTGITLSEEQLRVARKRVRERGLEDRVEFLLSDYRDIRGDFDRIVSVGMFEHVGLPNYDTYFRTVRDRLTAEGVALIHTIGATSGPAPTNPWIAKYIFPGGYIPSLSEVVKPIERQDVRITDIELLWLHYAETLRHWQERLEANADKVCDLFDERFLRMWRFYLAASEQTFRHRTQTVFQVQIAKSPTAVPMTRDYMYPEAQRLEKAGE